MKNQLTSLDYRPQNGDSRGIVNGRLVIEFKAGKRCNPENDTMAGTLVCEEFTAEELDAWYNQLAALHDEEYASLYSYPDRTTTINGILFHIDGRFTPREK